MCKKRIGITQKTMQHPQYDEMMDCLDMRWSALFNQLGFLLIPLPNLAPADVEQQLEMLALDGLILSGGNSLSDIAKDEKESANLSPQRDAYEMAMIQACADKNIPIFGVCRGLQILNLFFGGNLSKVENHAGKAKHPLFAAEKDALFACPAQVNSYHNYGIAPHQLAENLVALARDSDHYIEAFKHIRKPIMAIMWHPEREEKFSQDDINLLKGFFAS